MVDLPFGMGGDLLAARAPFLDPADGEARGDQQIQVGRERAVLLAGKGGAFITGQTLIADGGSTIGG